MNTLFSKIIIVLFILLLTGCEAATEREKDSELLHFVTFNIRYDNPDDGINRWENRLPIVEDYFNIESPDIIGMQEVLHNQLLDLQEIMPDYDYVGTGRDDGDTGGEYSPVFFNTNKFELMDDGQFWLSETPDVPGSIGWDADLPRIVTWARLKHKPVGKEIFVFNTHFDHRGIEAREESVNLMAQKMREIADAGSYPLVAMGDFNIQRNHPQRGEEYYHLTNTFRDINSLKNSRFAAVVSVSDGATFNGFDPDWRTTRASHEAIDYLFINDYFDPHLYRVDHVMNQIGNIFISDHWPVVLKVSYFD